WRTPTEGLVVLDRLHHTARRVVYLVAPPLEGLRHGQQHPPQTRAAMPVLRWKVGSTKERLPVRSQKLRQRPSPLSTDRRHRRLVACIHIGPLIPVHLHRDEVIIDHL